MLVFTVRLTAVKLVDPVEYKMTARVYENNKWQMAVALNITSQVLADYETILTGKKLQMSLPFFSEVPYK